MSKRFERCEFNAFAIYDNEKQITINMASMYEREQLMEILDELQPEHCARCGKQVVMVEDFKV